MVEVLLISHSVRDAMVKDPALFLSALTNTGSAAKAAPPSGLIDFYQYQNSSENDSTSK